MLLSAALWLLALELLGLAVWPLASRLFHGWADLGFAQAKILGLVVLGYLLWLTGTLGLTGFTGATAMVVAVILAVLVWAREGERVRDGWAQARPLILAEEAVFLVLFAGGVWVRSFSPSIAGTEKPMDFTFLHALIRAETLPAEDPWLAGFRLPYYYFGYLLHSVVAKASGVEPAIAYNLAVVGTWALMGIGAMGIVTCLTRRAGSTVAAASLWGVLGAFALGIMANLEAFFEVVAARGFGDRDFWNAVGIKNLSPAGEGASFVPFQGGWWFRAARVIPNIQPDGITEFPFFSFLLADLHPHYMALPLGVLILALAAHQLSDQGQPSGTGALNRFLGPDPVRTGLQGVALGAVIPTNTWDVPVFWGAFVAAAIGGALRASGPSWEQIRGRAEQLAVLLVLGVLLYAPYFIDYVSQALGVGLVEERTLFGSLLVLFGPLLVLPLVAGAVGVAGSRAPATRWVGASAALAGVLLALSGEPTLGFLLAALAGWVALAWERSVTRGAPETIAGAGLACLGLGAVLVPELVFLRDTFGTRMNTVFKFYYDAWVLLALAAPLLGHELFLAVRQEPREALRYAAAGGLGFFSVLAVLGSIYPAAATATKSAGFSGGPTLDGMAYLRTARPDDVRAIEWLRASPRGLRVLEAVGDAYTDAGRFSTFGGAAAPMGWVGHELQWRGSIPELVRRPELTRVAYVEPFEARWREALKELGVTVIAVGSLEREIYGPQAGAHFEGVLEPAYRAGNTVLYWAPKE